MSQRCSSLLFPPLAAGSHRFIAVALLLKAGDERRTRTIVCRHFFGMNQQKFTPERFSNQRRNPVAIPLLLKRCFYGDFISPAKFETYTRDHQRAGVAVKAYRVNQSEARVNILFTTT